MRAQLENLINVTEIKQLSNQYGFKCNVLGDKVIINSKLDNWVAEVKDQGQIILYHQDKGTKKYRHHRQGINKKKFQSNRVFYDFPFIFKSIQSHDDHKLNRDYKKMRRIDMLLKQIERGEI